MKKEMQALLNKKMDRRDFLKHVGFGALLLMGLGSIVKLLGTSVNSTTKTTAQNQPMTYGASVYGGKRSS